ncbi:hypothetical protein GWI33_017713 [Rhynchophorus ferrugineus]|uniref:Uncharacterized protein n=1 Tax=Rhynchophorus ferrugineus TaxID=354439 RepID=A0A834HYS4_RHYFE|nr:hypothetical protein GWI33_017713 [Rhynchophorus ferrugineus]
MGALGNRQELPTGAVAGGTANGTRRAGRQRGVNLFREPRLSMSAEEGERGEGERWGRVQNCFYVGYAAS